jgi:adenylate cyclase
MSLPPFLMLSLIVVAYEKSDRYVEAAAVTAVALPLLWYAYSLPGLGQFHLVERWAAGHDVDRTSALDATYVTSRGTVARGLASIVVWLACCLSLSVRSPGRPGRGWSNTGSWAPVGELPPI